MLNGLRVDFDKNRGSFVKKPHLTQSELGVDLLETYGLIYKSFTSDRISAIGSWNQTVEDC
jgi:hypothetical protein